MPVPSYASVRAHLHLARNEVLDGLALGLREQGGDAVTFRLPAAPLVVIAAPTAAEALLKERWPRVRKSAVIRSMSEAVGDGLLTADDPVATAQRKELAPLLTPRHVTGWARAMDEIALRHLPDDGERDPGPSMAATALDIVSSTLFGEGAGAEARAVADGLDAWMTAFQHDTNSWRRLLPRALRPGRGAQQQVVADLRRVVLDLVERRRGRAIEGDDLLGRLLAAETASGERATDDAWCTALLTLFVAGHETTALTLSWAAWLLSRHPEVQAALREEVGRLGRPSSPHELAARPVLSGVVDETMRLYPPAFGVGREALEDLELPLVGAGVPPGGIAASLGSVIVPRGATAVVSFLALHRDPRWWREPLAFRPERWWNGEAVAAPRGAYLPFGTGPRVCVGAHFARLEVAVVLARWASALDLGPAGPADIPLRASVTLRSAVPLRIAVARRSARAAA